MIKKLRVTVDGKSFDVTVEMPEDLAVSPSLQPPPGSPAPSPPLPPQAPEPVHAAPVAPPAAAAPGSGEVPSPLAGRVIAIIAQAGRQIKENDHLLTIEAMKMNTFVFAPQAGKVAEIKVSVGDAVKEAQVLARIE
jgi:glutaconyl-CoA/methylmalonyl-CoA decarboxylase subunit gamma